MKPLVVVAVLLACGGKQPRAAAPNPAHLAAIADLDSSLATRPDDPILLMWRAYFTAELARTDEALHFLERLDRTGWDIPFAPNDFKPLADDPRFRAIAARIAARAVKVKRSDLAFTIADPAMIPEGIAVDPATGTFYVGSIRKRAIIAIDRDRKPRTFVPAQHDNISSVLGMKVDAERGLLWVASYPDPGMEGYRDADHGRSEVTAYALADGTQRRKAVFAPGKAPHLLNDVAIAADGTVYVTDSLAGAVWRVPPDRDVLEPVTKPGSFAYPNGIVLAWTNKLFIAHRTGIAIVDPADGAIMPMAAGPRLPVAGIDGLLLDGKTLYAVQNNLGAARLVAITVDDTGTRATGLTVLENDPTVLELPTTSALYEGGLYTIANSQLDAIGPGGLVQGKQLFDPRIVRTPVRL